MRIQVDFLINTFVAAYD